MNTNSLVQSALLTVCVFGGPLIAGQAIADADITRGEALAYSCLGCHGIDGYRNAYPSYRVPKLGGQKAAYIAIALRGYRDGTRQHPTMQGQAGSLSDEDIDDLSAYLATLGSEGVDAGGTDGASLEAAQSCAACHGANGISTSPSWPTLAGQHEDYLVHALQQYRNGERSDPVMAPMAAVLDDADVRLLARYFAGLDGLRTSEPD